MRRIFAKQLEGWGIRNKSPKVGGGLKSKIHVERCSEWLGKEGTAECWFVKKEEKRREKGFEISKNHRSFYQEWIAEL